MAYNQNIPQATDDPSVSQAQLLGNFLAIKQLVDVNHGTFSAADEGKHKYVTLPQQAAAPATAALEMALYVKDNGGVPTPYIRQQSSGTEYNLLTQYAGTNPGWARLPGGLIMKWGTQSVSITGDGYVTYPVGATIPVFTTVLSAQVSVLYALIPGNDVDAAIRVTSFADVTKLRVYGSHRFSAGANAVTFTWLVIGI